MERKSHTGSLRTVKTRSGGGRWMAAVPKRYSTRTRLICFPSQLTGPLMGNIFRCMQAANGEFSPIGVCLLRAGMHFGPRQRPALRKVNMKVNFLPTADGFATSLMKRGGRKYTL